MSASFPQQSTPPVTRPTGPGERTARDSGAPTIVNDEVAYLCTGIVNVAFVGRVDGEFSHWCLVDAGIMGYTNAIIRAAEERYGPNARPQAIILTHGHFDHIGCVQELAKYWEVPVYAHPLEFPYLNGKSSYPPPDPTVGGGAMSTLSWTFPRGPIDLGTYLQPLNEDGTIAELPQWRWVATPGHSPGHVSLINEITRTLVAGDAFTTTKQESLVGALTQAPKLHGPPMYYTCDWQAAEASVRKLAALHPRAALTGHGVPMFGGDLQQGLLRLADEFRERALPWRGRYRNRPAVTDENGVVSLPPDVAHLLPWFIAGCGAGVVLMKILQARHQPSTPQGFWRQLQNSVEEQYHRLRENAGEQYEHLRETAGRQYDYLRETAEDQYDRLRHKLGS